MQTARASTRSPMARWTSSSRAMCSSTCPASNTCCTRWPKLAACSDPAATSSFSSRTSDLPVASTGDYFDHHLPLTERSLVEALGLAELTPVEVRPRFLPFTTKSRLPQHPLLVWLYLKLPLAHRLLGQQSWIVAAKPSGRLQRDGLDVLHLDACFHPALGVVRPLARHRAPGLLAAGIRSPIPQGPPAGSRRSGLPEEPRPRCGRRVLPVVSGEAISAAPRNVPRALFKRARF